GARAIASTWTPKPVVSGRGGSDWARARPGAVSRIRPATIVDCGLRIAEWRHCVPTPDRAWEPVLPIRNPQSPMRNWLPPQRIDRRQQADFRDIDARGSGDREQDGLCHVARL